MYLTIVRRTSFSNATVHFLAIIPLTLCEAKWFWSTPIISKYNKIKSFICFNNNLIIIIGPTYFCVTIETI